jgi:hypothetical protein
MSHPLPGVLTVVPDGMTALADELATLAAELAGNVERIRSAAASFPDALDGHAGWAAGATGTAWASLCHLVAGQTTALAGTLRAAVAAYVAEDAALAESVGPGRGPR